MSRGRWSVVAAVLALSAAATAFWFLAAVWAAFDAHRRAFSTAEGSRVANSARDGGVAAPLPEERASLKIRDARD